MTNVAAIREKFQQRDSGLTSSTDPQALMATVKGRSAIKNEPSKNYVDSFKQPILTTKMVSGTIKYLNTSKLNSGQNGHCARIEDASANATDDLKAKITDAELNRSSSLTDIVTAACEKQQKRSESTGSLTKSDETHDQNSSEVKSVILEMKSRFENNSHSARFSVKGSSVANISPKCKPSTLTKPILNLKPNSAVLTLEPCSNVVPSMPPSHSLAKKGDARKIGSGTIMSSSSSFISSGGLQNDLSSSTSSLSRASKNSLINEPSAFDRCIKGDSTRIPQRSLSSPKLNDSEMPKKKVCRRCPLPSLQELGSPPSKPVKPLFLRSEAIHSSASFKSASLPAKLPAKGYPLCQPPKRPPPKPPSEGSGKPLPPLPLQEDFYDDNKNTGDHVADLPKLISANEKSYSVSGCPLTNIIQSEELYNDIGNDEPELEEDDDIYETMELDPSQTDHVEVPGRQQIRPAQERKLKDELKDCDIEKEMAKLKEKFQLTGEEISLGNGKVKRTKKSKGYDLTVKEGEKVTIYRIKDTPEGKWLVKNEKGKFGYVELSNIEIDPHSVRTVMHTSYRYSEHYKSPKRFILQEDDDEIYQDILTLGFNEEN